jgi:hypothetical protein
MGELEPNHLVRFANIFIHRSCFAINYELYMKSAYEVDALVETWLIYEDRLLKMIIE